MEQNKRELLSTFMYSDIFDYPLRKTEIKRYYLGKAIDGEKTLMSLVHSNIIFFQHGLYCLSGRENIINKRLQREKISKKKLQSAQWVIQLLRIIPTIQLLGISGSLAMENADESDDIDIFIIAKAGSIWTTRFFVLLFLQVVGKRRKWNDKKERNSICANMFIDEKNLMLPMNKQNFFTAHEVVQMKPIFDRDNTYQKFLFANKWVKKYLPSTTIPHTKLSQKQEKSSWIENRLKSLQIWYMRRHRTTEYITDTILAFHPNNQERKVLLTFNNKLKAYGL